MEKILVIGCAGQIGSELTCALREKYGVENVVGSDIKPIEKKILCDGPFEQMDVLNVHQLYGVVQKYNITQIYHLAAVLSGNAEKRPLPSWDVNMESLMNILELSRELNIKKIFWPSSIAVFGPSTPKEATPQLTITEPNTVYGISKLAGERWVEYYHNKYNLDIRSIRYPGLISYKTEPGGGTTDYAVEIFYDAVNEGSYTCFLKNDTRLPMQFMPDAIQATIDLMEADPDHISVRSSYNVGGMSFSPDQIADNIRKHLPGFSIDYAPDFRQAIADSWPASINDDVAVKDWGLKNEYNLERMTRVMLEEIKKKLNKI